jgi:hypothetical protein
MQNTLSLVNLVPGFPIIVPTGQHLVFQLRRADNQCTLILDGTQVYDCWADGNPPLGTEFDLSAVMTDGTHNLLVLGNNWGKEGHLEFGFTIVGAPALPAITPANVAADALAIFFAMQFTIQQK